MRRKSINWIIVKNDNKKITPKKIIHFFQIKKKHSRHKIEKKSRNLKKLKKNEQI